jgi:hypothetical protein
VVDYSSGSGTAALTFNYTVAAGQNVAALDPASTTALALNTGTIKDLAANSATAGSTITLPTLAGINSIAGQKTITIDTTAPANPTFTSISPGTTGTTQTPTLTLAVSESETVTLYSNLGCTTPISAATAATSPSVAITTSSLTANSPTSIYVNATDVATNTSTCSASALTTYTPDTILPTVSSFVRQASPVQASQTNALPAYFTITFSEAMSTASFTAADISNAGTATGVTWTVTSVSSTVFTVAATGSGKGTLIPRLAAGSVTDSAGNANAALSDASQSVDYSNSSLTVTVDQASGQADPTNSGVISYKVVFSNQVLSANFPSSKISTTGSSATGITWGTPTTSDNLTYTVATTAVTGAGTVIPYIAAGQITDVYGNTNTISTSADNSVTLDNVAPGAPTYLSISPSTSGTTQTPTVTLGNITEAQTMTLYSNAGCTAAISPATALTPSTGSITTTSLTANAPTAI